MNTELRIKEWKLQNMKFSWFSHTSYFILHTSSRRGFTIIETLVAISILLLLIVAPLTLAEKSLASAETARYEITAFYLAQEAIEYIRNVRDSNALSGQGGQNNWLQGLSQCAPALGGCGVDSTATPQSAQIVRCTSSNGQCRLWQSTGNPSSPLYGLFGHRTSGSQGWTETVFARKIEITEIEPNVEAEVKVTVTWTAGSLRTSRVLTVKENIFSWYEP